MHKILKSIRVAQFAKGFVAGFATEYFRTFLLDKKIKEEETRKYKEIILKSVRNYKNLAFFNSYNNNITEYNFVQGKLGNCGMIASMATLASNRELYDKVVPSDQNFQVSSQPNSSEFVFNLYKWGKLHKVVVDGNLPKDKNGLIYSKSYNKNLVGPLLEKALIKLHFNENYKSAVCVEDYYVLTSFANNFFEQHAIYYDPIPTID